VPIASKTTVLVVEDDAAVRGLIALALYRMGHVVVTAADAPAALDLARTQRFDLVIADVGLPGGSGLTLVAEIRALLPDIGVLVVSGSPLRGPSTASPDQHIEVLEKPFRLDRLRAAVNEALRAAGASSRS
jgi:two-component system nitrogen regulation response regulator GlnG